MARPVLVVMSLVFLVPGGVMVFGRRSVTLNTSLGTVTRCYSAIVPLLTDRRHLYEFNAIVVGFEPGGSESIDKFPLQLRPIAGKTFTILSSVSFGESRTLAAFLAGELHLPLADTTTEHEVILAPEHASESLQERLRSAPADRPSPPPLMRSTVNESAVETTIAIPHQSSPLEGALAALTGAVVLLVVAPTVWRIWSHASAPLPVRLIFVLFLALLFGIAPLSWAGKAFGWIRSRVLVRISSSGLVVERQSAWSSKTERIAAADILDVDFSTVQGTHSIGPSFHRKTRESAVKPRRDREIAHGTRYIRPIPPGRRTSFPGVRVEEIARR